MLTKSCRVLCFSFMLLLPAAFIHAQVRTKIFEAGLPATVIPVHQPPQVFTIEIPANRIQQARTNTGNAKEYDNQFALPVATDIDVLQSAAITTSGGITEYSLTVHAVNALNLSFQFSKFRLSENAVLSIFNGYELTDSITAHENNEAGLWATRVYQGDRLHIVLKMPNAEAANNLLKIGQVSYGYQAYGTSFIGNTGASATCNINVLCPTGREWEAERNSVALMLVADGSSYCTGTMVMNTCSSNIPYLLTANHCLRGNLQNWVFQFRYWSNNCNGAISWREDLQINGCKLKANKATSDFALVELNQPPPPNSKITYSGWERSNIPATQTTSLHHPKGDVMKISRDFQPPVAVSWLYAGAATHWRAIFDEGIVQFGSSGGPLYDQEHRLVGQLHGNQNNVCQENTSDNDCWCGTQIPAVGEYGRFDVSWDAGGTPQTQLSNWLNYTGYEGIMNTNTTAVADLKNAFLDMNIDGLPAICTGSSSFRLMGAPVGSYITWTISNTALATITFNGTQAVVTKTNSQAHGEVTITATVNDNCYRNTVVSRTILIGGAYGNDITISPNGYNNCYNMLSYYTLQATPASTENSYSMDYEWSYLQESNIIFTSWQPLPGNGPVSQFSFLIPGNYTIRLATTDICGQENYEFKTIKVSPLCFGIVIGGDWSIDILKMDLSPNPVTTRLTVQLKMPDEREIKNIPALMRITDKFGTVYYTQKITLDRFLTVNTSALRTGNYFLTIEADGKRISKQFVVF